MTTFRERAERGDLDEEMIKFLKQNLGTVPLCCIGLKPKGDMWCETLGEWLPKEKFHEKCLACQEEIKKALK